MRLGAVPLTTSGAATPDLAPGFRGVAIHAARVPGQGEFVQIHGSFRIPSKSAAEIGSPVHRALSCSVWGKGYQDSVDPFRDGLLFPDDETRDGEVVAGAFSFQVSMYRGAGLYLHVALGQHLSAGIPCPP